jgi:hypothetical protein
VHLSQPRETVKSAAPLGAVAVESLGRFESLNSPSWVACSGFYFMKIIRQPPSKQTFFAIKNSRKFKKYRRQKE